jgi:hypothetical protein
MPAPAQGCDLHPGAPLRLVRGGWDCRRCAGGGWGKLVEECLRPLAGIAHLANGVELPRSPLPDYYRAAGLEELDHEDDCRRRGHAGAAQALVFGRWVCEDCAREAGLIRMSPASRGHVGG